MILMPRFAFRPLVAAIVMLAAGPALATNAAEPPVSPAAEGGDNAAALDARMAAELTRLEHLLDPVSAGVVRDNQVLWEAWFRSDQDWASARVAEKQATDREVAEALLFVRQQRITFLQSIKPAVPEGVRGGWGDGMREVMLDVGADKHARLVSRTNVVGGGAAALCSVQGSVKEEGGVLTLLPDGAPDRPIRISRKGVALSIEDGQAGANPPYCKPGGGLAGQYFHIEGADKVIPWLM